ncbi:hypothetical protein KP509_1Z083300 [Ceratopteris richardii]|nr:hypothetical protein KP509_1Z083300 [Ceratopteris richardii]
MQGCWVFLRGHCIPPSLSEAVLRVSHEFFESSHENKIKMQLSSATGFRGYQVIGQNVTKGMPDMHEAIDFYKEFNENAYGELGKPLCAPNLWPEIPSDFRITMERYLIAMEELAKRILRGIALALGGPPDAFESSAASDPFWVLRVIGYPPLKENKGSDDDNHSAFSCGAHTDYGLLTFVNQDAEPCALQVKNQVGEWIWAPHIPHTFVVNIGDMLQVFSNGLYHSTLHRVINNSSLYRVSVPFFLEPNFNAGVEPFEFCRKGREANECLRLTESPVIYGQHLVNKVLSNFY